jgi:hypothetical protein
MLAYKDRQRLTVEERKTTLNNTLAISAITVETLSKQQERRVMTETSLTETAAPNFAQ